MRHLDLTEYDIVAIWESTDTSLELAETFQISEKVVELIKSGKYGSQYTRDLVKSKKPATNQRKLKKDQILEILSSGEPSHILGVRYGVCASTIRNVRNGKSWKQFSDVKRKELKPFNIVKGEDHSKAVLTEEQVLEILKLFPTHSNTFLAEKYGVSVSCISTIRKGRSRCHLTEGRKLEKSNGVYGCDRANRRLSPEVLAEIHKSSESNGVLAKKYGVKRRTIWAVRTGRSWKHSDTIQYAV
jgi:hypothetical protein